jgi:hypothetical protein
MGIALHYREFHWAGKVRRARGLSATLTADKRSEVHGEIRGSELLQLSQTHFFIFNNDKTIAPLGW